VLSDSGWKSCDLIIPHIQPEQSRKTAEEAVRERADLKYTWLQPADQGGATPGAGLHNTIP